jgi:lipoic acid synthetase
MKQKTAEVSRLSNYLPPWFRQEIPNAATQEKINFFKELNLTTVCLEAHCPNLTSCFNGAKFTFLILGGVCTRNCAFCAVTKSSLLDLNQDFDEPRRIAKAVEKFGPKYVVITSVTRDDLPDGGAEIFARTVALIRGQDNRVKVEVLIPDFKGHEKSLKRVVEAKPDVIGHNIETVRRLYKNLRPKAGYDLSIGVLARIKQLDGAIITKSSLMLGLGEKEAQVIAALRDLRGGLCDILTLGQYLSPSPAHYPVKEFIAPEQFNKYKEIGLELGFKAVLSGPLVRSSYQAEVVYQQLVKEFP